MSTDREPLMGAAPTKAEKAALVYLVALGDATITGGAFVRYYEQKTGTPYTVDRGHGWRRTGGRVLRRMAEKGLVRQTGSTWGSAEYAITESGRKAAASGD